MKPTPIKPRIIIAQVDASGTAADILMVESTVPAPVAVTVYSSVSEKGPAPALPSAVLTLVPMALNVAVESGEPVVNSPFPASMKVASVTLHPAGRVFDVKLLVKVLRPKGLVRP